MAITEEARFQLFEKLRKALGAEEAATLMEHLPPVGWGDVARQRDVDRLEVAMRSDVDRLEVAMRSEVDRLEGTMHATFATKVDLELALRQQTNRYIGWMVASNATLVATVSLIVGLR
jgi:hypothetical protein